MVLTVTQGDEGKLRGGSKVWAVKIVRKVEGRTTLEARP